jgi:hypothetical protein
VPAIRDQRPRARRPNDHSGHGQRPRGCDPRRRNRWDRDNLRTLPGLDLRGSGSTVTDAAGRWRVEGLVPGVEASVEAWDQISNMRASASIEMLEPGMNPPVELQLQPVAEPEPPGEVAPDD